MRRAALGLALGAIALAFACLYGPGLHQFFTADDFVLLHYARDTSAGEIVRERLLRGPRDDVASPWWRPGWLLLCNAGYEAFGLAPGALRGLVWGMHAVMAALVSGVARRATGSWAVAVAATALFALAPSYAEALLWVAAGLNVLPAALCLFVAAVAYAHFVESGAIGALLLAALLFLLSFLFREAGYHMPLVVVAAHLTLRTDVALPRRFVRGCLHALPFGAAVAAHNVFLNPFSLGGLSPQENLHLALRHGAEWLRTLLGVPASGWAMVAVLLVAAVALPRLTPRARFCLLWTVAAAFPFVARSHDTRFVYFVHAPAALTLALVVAAPGSRGWLRPILVTVLLGLAALNAARVPAAVRAAAAGAEVNAAFLDLVRREGLAEQPTVHIDFLPAELVSGAAEMLDLYLGRQVQVVNHALLDRPPFLVYGLPAFAELPDGAAMVHYDQGTRRFARTTRSSLIAGRPLLPMLAFRHAVRQVAAWSEVRFDPEVVHLRQAPPPLDLGGAGSGKVIAVRAGTVSRIDILVETARDGFLVFAFVSDLTTVGGRAWVDGSEVPLLVADGLFNAVPVRRGSREVVIKTSL